MAGMPDLTPGDGQDLYARFKEARQRRDVDRMLALFRDDAEYRADPFEPVLTGDVAIRDYWTDVAAAQANVEFDVERLWVVGRTVLANWHGAFTRRSSAERVRERGFTTLELDEAGLVSRCRMWAISRTVGTDSSFTVEPETDPGGPDGR
jgi:ketosteroid isomerase-like protein